MSKSVNQKAQDAFLDYIKSNADKAVLCEGAPTTYSDATTTLNNGGNQIAVRSIASGNLTKGAGDTSGRKITLDKGGYLAKENTTNGADHVALVDEGNSEIVAVTELDDGSGSPVSMTADLAYNQQTVDFEVQDPS